MHDPIGIPACFTGQNPMMDHDPMGSSNRSGQSIVVSVFRTKIASLCRLITITWCKNLLGHGFSIYVEGSNSQNQYSCKVELKPWYLWKKQGSKSFQVDGKSVDVFWDLKMAKLSGESPEPVSDYYVAIVCEEEVVLLVGDLKKEAFRKTRARPSLIDAILISKKEHVFGKKRFVTRAKFHNKGKFHEISIECTNNNNNNSSGNENINFLRLSDPEMAIKIDGLVVIHVKHLQWKFRGNESISINKVRIEVFWDVHDWLFSPGLSHALFIFKPSSPPSPTPPSSLSSLLSQGTIDSFGACSSSIEGNGLDGSHGFCLFLYAWKVE